jgi:hypothetical protein
MFKSWDSNTEPTTGTPTGCDYVLNESTGMPYGDSNVYYKNFADISDFEKLYVLIDAGTARIQMNRETDQGTTHIVYSSEAVTEVDFATANELQGFDYVHLNAIKDNWSGVTVSGMYLYRTITVTDAGYATFGTLSKTAKLNGVTGYAAKYNGTNVKLTPVTNVPVGKGVVVEAAAGSYAPTFDVEAGDIDTDLLVSNGTVKGDGATIYALGKKGEKAGFSIVKSGVTVPAGKAYLVIPAGGESRSFIEFGDGQTTGITEIGGMSQAERENVYNLNGQRVTKATKGLYIANGKKMLMK